MHKYIFLILSVFFIFGCMPDGYYELAKINAAERESYKNGQLPQVQNQCAVYAGGLRNRLIAEGYEPKLVRAMTPGSNEWNHIMVKVGDFYVDNNSWWPYMVDDSLFSDLVYYKIEE